MMLKLTERDGTRHRVLYVLKSRGMPHTHDTRGLEISARGLAVVDAHELSRARA